MWRRPIVQATRQGGGGGNIFAGPLGQRLVRVEVCDRAGRESDSATIVLADPGRRLPMPRKGEVYAILMGWQDQGPVLQGLFRVERWSHRGDPQSGEFLTIELRAADMSDKLKAFGRKHWDDGSTAGQIFGDLAKEAGLGLAIAPAIAAQKVGYRLRWDQSVIDFATELADEVGAVVKPAGGKLVVMERGAGRSGGGQALGAIRLRKTSGYRWDVAVDPRPVYGHVCAAWQDPKTGRRKLVKHPTGRQGPHHILPHPCRDEADAKRTAAAAAYDLGTNSGSGTFEHPGLPHARAGAIVIASGYGTGVDGRWIAEEVQHVVDKEAGYRTTVQVGAGQDDKSKASSSGQGSDRGGLTAPNNSAGSPTDGSTSVA